MTEVPAVAGSIITLDLLALTSINKKSFWIVICSWPDKTQAPQLKMKKCLEQVVTIFRDST
jgi:hypothetical protein